MIGPTNRLSPPLSVAVARLVGALDSYARGSAISFGPQTADNFYVIAIAPPGQRWQTTGHSEIVIAAKPSEFEAAVVTEIERSIRFGAFWPDSGQILSCIPETSPLK